MDAEHRPPGDHRLAALAEGQGGLVARRQLLALGLRRGAIDRRISRGRLLPHPTFRGVYAVGHRAGGPRAELWAACLAVGPAAVLSHRAAADLWEVRSTAGALIDLLVPYGYKRRTGLSLHRTASLPSRDRRRRHGLPVTSVARTLVDIGAVVPHRSVELAFDRAEMLGVLDHRDVARVLADAPGRPGAAALRRIVSRGAAGSTVTESPLEEDLLALVRRGGLPEPVLQHPVLSYRGDCCWPDARLIVEADGGAAHGTRSARAHDAERDVLLQNAGWTVLRFTAEQIRRRGAWVVEQTRVALLIAGRRTTPVGPPRGA